jgi:hypothetical protein
VAHRDLRPARTRRLLALRRLALKAVLALSRWHLDSQLATGVNPGESLRLRLWAEQITTPSSRRRLALSLMRVANEAGARAKPALSAAIPLRRDQVAESRETLAFLAQILLFAETVDARGVAIVRRLLADGGSPLYCAAEPGALEARLEVALHLLLGEPAAASVRRRGPLRTANGGSVGSS